MANSQETLANILASHGIGIPAEPVAPATESATVPGVNGPMQAYVQDELRKRLVAAQARFEAECKRVMDEADSIAKADIVTITMSAGEEAHWHHESGSLQSVKDLCNWMASNGWKPVGLAE